MPGPADVGTVSDISAELTLLGIATSLHASLLLAVDKAGYNVAPAGGGTAVPVATSLGSAFHPVAGVPGLAVLEVTAPGPSAVYRIVTALELAKPTRTPSSPIPVTTLAGATPASLTLIAVEMDILHLPIALLATLMQAIDDAGYELAGKTTGTAVVASAELAADLFTVSGFPSQILVVITLPDASTLERIVTDLELLGEVGLAGTL